MGCICILCIYIYIYIIYILYICNLIYIYIYKWGIDTLNKCGKPMGNAHRKRIYKWWVTSTGRLQDVQSDAGKCGKKLERHWDRIAGISLYYVYTHVYIYMLMYIYIYIC